MMTKQNEFNTQKNSQKNYVQQSVNSIKDSKQRGKQTIGKRITAIFLFVSLLAMNIVMQGFWEIPDLQVYASQGAKSVEGKQQISDLRVISGATDQGNGAEPAGSSYRSADTGVSGGQITSRTSSVTVPEGYIAIDSYDKFKQIGKIPEYPRDGKYIQTKNFTIPDNQHHQPVGTQDNAFSGIYDGGGCTISGNTVYLDNLPGEAYHGLFGRAWFATIRNMRVQIKNAIITANTAGFRAALLCGEMMNTNLEGCSLDSCTLTINIVNTCTTSTYIGMIGGTFEKAFGEEPITAKNMTVTNGRFQVQCDQTTVAGGILAGVFAGYIGGVEITSCSVDGVVSRTISMVNDNGFYKEGGFGGAIEKSTISNSNAYVSMGGTLNGPRTIQIGGFGGSIGTTASDSKSIFNYCGAVGHANGIVESEGNIYIAGGFASGIHGDHEFNHCSAYTYTHASVNGYHPVYRGEFCGLYAWSNRTFQGIGNLAGDTHTELELFGEADMVENTPASVLKNVPTESDLNYVYAPNGCSVFLSTKEYVKDSVTLYPYFADPVTASHELTYSWDNGVSYGSNNSQTVTENGTYTIYAKNKGGKTGSITCTVDNIDREPPTFAVAQDTTAWTAGSVTLTIQNATDAKCGLHDTPYSFDGGNTWTKEPSKSFSSNQTVSVKVRDALENISDAKTLTITNIDKTGPVIQTVNVSPTTWTNQPVTLTVNATDSGAGLAEKGAYSFDNGTTWQDAGTYTVTQNGTWKIKVKDALGNIGEAKEVTVGHIDTSAPQLTVSIPEDPGYPDTITWRQQKKIHIKAVDTESGVKTVRLIPPADSGLQQMDLSPAQPVNLAAGYEVDSVNLQKEGIYTVQILDQAGNQTEKTVEIQKVDTASPQAKDFTKSAVGDGKLTIHFLAGDVQKITGEQTLFGSGIAKVEYACATNREEAAALTESSWTELSGGTAQAGWAAYTFQLTEEQAGKQAYVRLTDQAGNQSSPIWAYESTQMIDVSIPGKMMYAVIPEEEQRKFYAPAYAFVNQSTLTRVQVDFTGNRAGSRTEFTLLSAEEPMETPNQLKLYLTGEAGGNFGEGKLPGDLLMNPSSSKCTLGILSKAPENGTGTNVGRLSLKAELYAYEGSERLLLRNDIKTGMKFSSVIGEEEKMPAVSTKTP